MIYVTNFETKFFLEIVPLTGFPKSVYLVFGIPYKI